jgi:hypothetical protein
MSAATIFDASLGQHRAATQDDIERLEALGANFFLTKRIIRKMLDFPKRVPGSTEELWEHHELLKKMMSLIESGHIEPGDGA